MKAFYDLISEIPEALRGEYEKKGTKYVLKVEGDHPDFVATTNHEELKTKLSEFRENNRKLNELSVKQATDLEKFKDIDPLEFGKMKTKLSEFEKTGVKAPDDIDARIQAALKPYGEKITALEGENTALKADNKKKDLEAARAARISTFTTVAAKHAVNETAIPDFLGRVNTVFGEDGVPRIDGKEVFSKADPTRHMTAEEFTVNLRETAPHLFKPSTGGGALPGHVAPRRVIAPDPLEMGRHADAIAKGEIVVALR